MEADSEKAANGTRVTISAASVPQQGTSFDSTTEPNPSSGK